MINNNLKTYLNKNEYLIKKYLLNDKIEDQYMIGEVLLFLQNNKIEELIKKLKQFMFNNFSINDIYENNIIEFFKFQESDNLENIIKIKFDKYNNNGSVTDDKLNDFFYKSIYSLLNIQYKIIKNIFYLLKIQKSKTKKIITEPNENIINYVKDVFNRYSNVNINSELLKNESSKKEFDDTTLYLKKLSNIFFENITNIKIYNFVVYGSHSLYLLNNNVKFNDIDLYTDKPILFMRLFSLIAKWVFDVDLAIVIVPLVKNYVTIKYNNINIFDLIYISKHDLNNSLITNVKIYNKQILNFQIQFYNLIHSFPDSHRIIQMAKKENYDNNLLKTSLILNRCLNDLDLDFNNIITKDIKIPKNIIIKDNYILLNSEDFLINDKHKNILTFKHILFINSIDESKFINLFDGLKDYYKVYKGIYNEITILAKKKISKKVKKSLMYVNGEVMYLNEEIDDDNKLTEVINSHLPCLIITNNTARLFYNESNNKLIDYSLETLISKILLSLYFMKYDNIIISEYLTYLILLIKKNNCDFLNQDNINIIKKYRTSSKNHKIFVQSKNYMHNFIYQFDNNQKKSVYSSLTEFKIGV